MKLSRERIEKTYLKLIIREPDLDCLLFKTE